MSLYGTLNVGKSALAVTQAAIQTHGNNIANAGNADHTRQAVNTSPTKGSRVGTDSIVGNGIQLEGVERQIDNALLLRLNATAGEAASATELATWLEQVETSFNELGDSDLSSSLTDFFNRWSELSADPSNADLRRNVISAGGTAAGRFNDVASRLGTIRRDAGDRIATFAKDADALSKQIADLNVQIVRSEGGGALGSANALRDRRDGLVKELSGLVNLNVREQKDGSLNVYVGSELLVQAGSSRGMSVRQTIDPDTQATTLEAVFNDGSPVNARAGQLAGVGSAYEKIDTTLARIDALAQSLKFEVNKLHAAGQGAAGHSSVTAEVAVADSSVGLDTLEWGHGPQNGSFEVHLRDAATGRFTSTIIDVNLDGTAASTSLDDVASDINSITGVSASVVDGKLVVSADAKGQEVTFANDSSHLLAAINVGGFFTGGGAQDLAVSNVLKNDPMKLAAATDDTAGNGDNAKAIADLLDRKHADLGGMTTLGALEGIVFDVSTSIRAARSDGEAASAIVDTLEAQRQAVSGVSLDEEAVKLMQYQRSYQGAARLIAAVDEMMQTLLQLV